MTNTDIENIQKEGFTTFETNALNGVLGDLEYCIKRDLDFDITSMQSRLLLKYIRSLEAAVNRYER